LTQIGAPISKSAQPGGRGFIFDRSSTGCVGTGNGVNHGAQTVKTNFTQRRIKARKSSACGLCKPWKKGGADKKTVRDFRHAQRAQQQFREVGF
jgi:hypothetical protein